MKLKLFEPRAEGAIVTYLSDFGSVAVPNDVYGRVVELDEAGQRAWEADAKRQIAEQWVNGAHNKDIVLTL